MQRTNDFGLCPHSPDVGEEEDTGATDNAAEAKGRKVVGPVVGLDKGRSVGNGETWGGGEKRERERENPQVFLSKLSRIGHW